MGKNEMKKKKPKNLLTVMTSAILLTLCIACFLQVTISARRMQQMPLVLNRFEGVYSYDGIHWQPITEQDMPSGKHNNVVLRGHFVNEVPEARRLYYYRNHIAVSIYRNGEPILSDWGIQMSEQGYRMTVENCGREWRFIVSPGITPEDTLEILLQNPHRYVNQTAYRDFLSTLYVGNGSTNVLENMLQNRSFFLRWSALCCACFPLCCSVLRPLRGCCTFVRICTLQTMHWHHCSAAFSCWRIWLISAFGAH